KLGISKNLNHSTLTPRTISKSCNKVAIQEINPAPAFNLALACPDRTCMPKLAIVAVLETNPEAKADKMRALSLDRIRFATYAMDCTIKIKISNFRMI